MYLASSLKHLQINQLDDPNNTKYPMRRDALDSFNTSAFTKRENLNFPDDAHDLISAAEIIKGSKCTN